MIVNFKYRKLRAQWAKLLIVNPGLCFIALLAIHRSGSNLYVVQIFRTEWVQRSYYPGDPEKKSVHQYWGGIDLGIHRYGLTKSGELANGLNEEFIYDGRRPKVKTAVIHNVGHGVHMHLQNRVRLF
jgi:hypothetical protein